MTMQATLDKIYAAENGTALRFDLFRRDTDEPLPAVVCIHGGGWVSGDKSDMRDIAKFFADQGFAAACPQYRVAPLYPYPAALNDCRQFMRFLRKNAKEYGVVADRIGVIGNSAGGHLSACMAMEDLTDQAPAAQANAAVNICGLTDLTNPTEQHLPIAWDFIGQFMGGPYVGNEASWVEASPIYHVSANSAPMLIIHGKDDDIVSPQQSIRLHQALVAAGARAELILLDNEGHGFTESAYREILERSLEFFRKELTN